MRKRCWVLFSSIRFDVSFDAIFSFCSKFLLIVCKTTDQKSVRRLCRLKSVWKNIRELLVYAHFHKRLIYCFRRRNALKIAKVLEKTNGVDNDLLFYIYVKPKFTYRKKSLLDIKLCKKWREIKKKEEEKKNTRVHCTRCWRVYKHLDLDSVSMILSNVTGTVLIFLLFVHSIAKAKNGVNRKKLKDIYTHYGHEQLQKKNLYLYVKIWMSYLPYPPKYNTNKLEHCIDMNKKKKEKSL